MYGYPGRRDQWLDGSFAQGQRHAEIIQARHEEMAAFMAFAHAKFTGQVGVCLGDQRTWAIEISERIGMMRSLITSLLLRSSDRQRQRLWAAHISRGRSGFIVQGCGRRIRMPSGQPTAARHAVDRAIRIAIDQLNGYMCHFSKRHSGDGCGAGLRHTRITLVHSGNGMPVSVHDSQESELHRAADLLNSGEKTAMLVGAGALQATDEVLTTAELLGAGVAKPGSAKLSFPTIYPTAPALSVCLEPSRAGTS